MRDAVLYAVALAVDRVFSVEVAVHFIASQPTMPELVFGTRVPGSIRPSRGVRTREIRGLTGLSREVKSFVQ